MNNKDDVINGLRVSDFDYLLEYCSNQQLTNFNDINKLKELKQSIMKKN